MEADVRLQGHLINRHILSRLIETIIELGASYEILSLRLGQTEDDPSDAVIRVNAPNTLLLEKVLKRVRDLGGAPLVPLPVKLEPAPSDGVLPDRFYPTTNLPTEIFIGDGWMPVEGEEMDLAVVVDRSRSSARGVPMDDVRAGDLVVVGEEGVRVKPLPRMEGGFEFQFMTSTVSSEKPKGPLLEKVARNLRSVRDAGKKILLVAGPAVIHTGCGPILERLIHGGWVDVLFAGNALAAHDVEQALLGTSLGTSVKGGGHVREGHAHHLWAINAIRRCGSIYVAVESGLLKDGVMHACVTKKIPFVLAGSIRDDGPLPEVITDAIDAQKAMRALIPGVGAAIMVGTTLHSIATGNLLPASVFTVCVDINPGVVTKLHDRGSRQSVGIVMDAGSFFERLEKALEA